MITRSMLQAVSRKNAAGGGAEVPTPTFTLTFDSSTGYTLLFGASISGGSIIYDGDCGWASPNQTGFSDGDECVIAIEFTYTSGTNIRYGAGASGWTDGNTINLAVSGSYSTQAGESTWAAAGDKISSYSTGSTGSFLGSVQTLYAWANPSAAEKAAIYAMYQN